MDKLNEKRTQPLGKVKPSLNKKLMDYCKLIGVQKMFRTKYKQDDDNDETTYILLIA